MEYKQTDTYIDIIIFAISDNKNARNIEEK